MTDGASSTMSCPAEILDWIPWYPGPGLSEAQKGAVEAHAAVCARCREELALLAGQGPLDPEDLPEPEAVYERVLARMADEGAGGAGAAGADVPPLVAHDPPAVSDRDRDRDRSRRARRRAALLVAAASAAVGVAFGWLAGSGIAHPVDREQADPERVIAEAVMERGGAIDVVFREDATVAEIQEALRALGARMAEASPGAEVVRLHLPSQSDPRAAARLLRAAPGGVAVTAEPVLLSRVDP